MKLTNEQAINLFSALNGLDGYDRVVNGSGTEQVVREIYRFGGTVRLAVAKNINALKPTVDAFTEARNSLIKEISNGAGHFNTVTNPEMATKLLIEEKIIMEAETDNINLVTISVADLRLDENPIPSSRLAFLSPILQE